MKMTDLLEDVGRPVAFYPGLAAAIGGIKNAVFVCQMLYWDGKESDADGWIRKPQDEITEETGLSRHETDSVRKSLVNAGLMEEERRGENGQMHYRIIKDALNDVWDNYQEKLRLTKSGNAGKRQTGVTESGKPVCHKPANRTAINRQSLSNTETTTETTAESECARTHAVADAIPAEPVAQPDDSSQGEREPSRSKDSAGRRPSKSDIFTAYPRPSFRDEAIPAIADALRKIAAETLCGSELPEVWLLARTLEFAASPAGQPPPAGQTDYRRSPAKWFNGGGYNDRHEWSKPNGKSNRTSADHNAQSASTLNSFIGTCAAARVGDSAGASGGGRSGVAGNGGSNGPTHSVHAPGLRTRIAARARAAVEGSAVGGPVHALPRPRQ